jgi:hypothetical protein
MTETDPSLERQVNTAAEYCAKTDRETRLHSGTHFLVALGIGLAASVIVYALRPAPRPRQRFTRALADMEKRLQGISRPALRRVNALASEGVHAVADGVQSGETHVEHFLRDASRRLRGFWS